MTIEQTIELIKKLMGGRKDWRGRDYFVHDIEVMQMLGAEASELEKKTALLHSVLDEKVVTAEELLRIGVDPDVVKLVTLVSNGPNVKGYAAYLNKCRRIVASGNESAMRVKLADMLANEGHPTNNYTETIAIIRAGLAAAAATE